MRDLVDESTRWYAVIALQSKSPRERFVIAYSDERSLRSFLAAPSIVGLGYGSRDEAIANMERCAPAIVGDVRNFTRTRNIIRRILQHSVAAAIVFFYSRNLLSATVRSFVSF
jgi:hypothetical protein